MAIRIGSDKRRGARAGRPRGDRRTRLALKDVAQFAPNFSVYVLPPDSVCLYSEDRKFFLHGELYCALASAVGAGARSLRDIARDLKKDFPSDKIDEAVKRLLDRRYLVPATASFSDIAAACWASIG